jgi:hypothetical protein
MIKPRICIGIPQPEMTNHWFQDCLLQLLFVSAQELEICRYNAVGSGISRNRNKLVEHAKEMKATHLLQIDADSVFPSDSLKRLLVHDKDIIGATTSARAGTVGQPMCRPCDPEDKSDVISVSLIGMNFMLIKMEVFDKLRLPYYADPPRYLVEKDPDPSLPELIAEDEYFCMTARKAGFDVLCDMKLSKELGHIGSTIFFIK